MANIWDDEERVSEYELIEDDAKQAEELAEEYASNVTITEASDQDLEEIVEESSFDLSKKEANVVYNARLRLEQARLYEMLINHNLFEGVSASPEAIANVQNELKFYIVKRLEILLGISQPPPIRQPLPEQVPTNFNDVEVDFLKQLAYKGTLGASAREKGSATKETEGIRPASPTAPVGGLKPLTPKSPVLKKAVPKPKPEIPKEPVSLVADKPMLKKSDAPQTPRSEPIQRKQAIKKEKPALKIRESGLGRVLTEQEAELIAKEELSRNPPKKPFKDMSAKEKAERIKEVNEKYKRPSTTTPVMPMPSENELTMKYMTQQAAGSNSRNATEQFNIMLANALAVQKTKGE